MPLAQILVPYLRSKAADLYERLGGGVDSDLFSDTPAAAHPSFSEPQVSPFLTLTTPLSLPCVR